MRHRLPTPPDLIDNPQLASIVLLEQVLEVTRLAVLAAYPDLWDGDPDTTIHDEERAFAGLIFYQIDVLQRLLDAYRRSLTRSSRPPPPPEDIPF